MNGRVTMYLHRLEERTNKKTGKPFTFARVNLAYPAGPDEGVWGEIYFNGAMRSLRGIAQGDHLRLENTHIRGYDRTATWTDEHGVEQEGVFRRFVLRPVEGRQMRWVKESNRASIDPSSLLVVDETGENGVSASVAVEQEKSLPAPETAEPPPTHPSDNA